MHTKKRLKKKRLILWCGNNEAIYPLSLSLSVRKRSKREEQACKWNSRFSQFYGYSCSIKAHTGPGVISRINRSDRTTKSESHFPKCFDAQMCARAQPFDAVIIAFLCYLFTVALFEHEAIHFQLDRNIEYFSNIDWLINEPMRFPSFHHEKRARARSQLDAKTKTVWKYSGLSFMGANDNL